VHVQIIWFTKQKLESGITQLIEQLPDEKNGLVVLLTRNDSLEDQFLDAQQQLAMQAIRTIPVEDELCVARLVSSLLSVTSSNAGAAAISFNKRVHTALKESGQR
jgi:hypothetical protein